MNHWIYELPHKAVIHTRKCVTKDVLMHYGVPGQKWGVITKEYEPVAVDHRRTSISKPQARTIRTYNPSGSNLSRRQVRELSRREREGYYTKENGRTVWRQNGKSYSPTEQRQKIVKRALIGAGAVAGLLIAYGAIRYHKIQKAKAYSGILNRFLHKNPNASLTTEAGKKLYRRGLDLANANIKRGSDIKNVNHYLKNRGLALSNRKALKIYKARKGLERMTVDSQTKNKVAQLIRKRRNAKTVRRVLEGVYGI